MRLQLRQLFTVRPVHGNPAPLGDKADNLVAGNRLAAARNVMHQITDAFYHHAAVVFAAVLRRIGLLLKLFQRGSILFGGAWLIELRLQEVHHLVEANITAANGRQQLFHVVKVIARQQVLLGFLEADAQMFQLVIEDLTASQHVFVFVLLTEPGVDF